MGGLGLGHTERRSAGLLIPLWSYDSFGALPCLLGGSPYISVLALSAMQTLPWHCKQNRWGTRLDSPGSRQLDHFYTAAYGPGAFLAFLAPAIIGDGKISRHFLQGEGTCSVARIVRNPIAHPWSIGGGGVCHGMCRASPMGRRSPALGWWGYVCSVMLRKRSASIRASRESPAPRASKMILPSVMRAWCTSSPPGDRTVEGGNGVPHMGRSIGKELPPGIAVQLVSCIGDAHGGAPPVGA
jgi:hypothetical protein